MNGQISIRGGTGSIWTGRVAVILVLVILMGASLFIRADYADQESLWPDEALYLYIGRNLSSDPSDLTGIEGEFFYLSPPVLVYSLSLVEHISTVPFETAARSLIIAMGLASILLTYLIGRKLFGLGVGLLAAAFLAVCPLSNWNGVRVLTDGPLVFFICLALCMLVYGRKPLFYIFAACAVLTKYSAFPILFLPLLTKMRIRTWSLIYAGIAVLLGLFVAVKGMFNVPPGWMSYFYKFFRVPDPRHIFYEAEFFLGWYILLLIALGAFFIIRERKFSALFHWLCLFGVFRIFLPWMVFRVSRYSMPLYPALYIVAAYGVWSTARAVARRWPSYRILPVAVFSASLLWVAYDHTVRSIAMLEQTSSTFIGYEEACLFIAERPGPHSVATASPRQMKYFGPGLTVHDIEEGTSPSGLRELVDTEGIGYLSIDLWSPHLPPWCRNYDYRANGYELVYADSSVFVFTVE